MNTFLKHKPTPQQSLSIETFKNFVESDSNSSAFIFTGYAGTGKTTTIRSIIDILPEYKLDCVLLAPTGKAAKILSLSTERQAFTIHKKIYVKRGEKFVRGKNKHKNTMFIVDEASMISDLKDNTFGFSLLGDLINYVKEAENCRIMFIGDLAQLPPVNAIKSPALDKEYLKKNFDLNIMSCELTEVLRQKKTSGILANATYIRDLIRNENICVPAFKTRGYPDIYIIKGDKLMDGIRYSYKKYGIENSLIICRSNRTANKYSKQIREEILSKNGDEISSGDYLMIVKNNYFYTADEISQSFIANGDISKVNKVNKIIDKYGFKFAEVVLEYPDYQNQPKVNCFILLDTLNSQSAGLSLSESKKLYHSIEQDYMHIKHKRKKIQAVFKDPFFNALQVKFAYAVTCHKSQGSQWKSVFVDQEYVNQDTMDLNYLRWLYTSLTRASEELYIIC